MTRILWYFLALLVLLNVVALMWPDKTVSAPQIYTEKEDVNPHFVRLNKEIEERFYRRSTEGITENSSVDVTDRAYDLSAALSDRELADSNEACYRIGPFMHQANYELAQAVLFNAGVDYKKSKRASRASNVFRIYLGPFDTRAEASDARVDLKRQKVLDHFVRKQDDGLLMVSLGIYSTPESAATARTLFTDKLGEVVKQRSENVVLPDSYWLHFEVGGDQRMLNQLVVIDWGEPSAKMGLFGCRS
ncbi:MAG: SPOR domain-containing protein [Arenicella sp.]|nr:SPOR domain-containing protein [Arenicella sp.]